MILLKREIDILRTVEHPTLIRLEDVYEDEMNLHLVRSKDVGRRQFRPMTDGGLDVLYQF